SRVVRNRDEPPLSWPTQLGCRNLGARPNSVRDLSYSEPGTGRAAPYDIARGFRDMRSARSTRTRRRRLLTYRARRASTTLARHVARDCACDLAAAAHLLARLARRSASTLRTFAARSSLGSAPCGARSQLRDACLRCSSGRPTGKCGAIRASTCIRLLGGIDHLCVFHAGRRATLTEH